METTVQVAIVLLNAFGVVGNFKMIGKRPEGDRYRQFGWYTFQQIITTIAVLVLWDTPDRWASVGLWAFIATLWGAWTYEFQQLRRQVGQPIIGTHDAVGALILAVLRIGLVMFLWP